MIIHLLAFCFVQIKETHWFVMLQRGWILIFLCRNIWYSCRAKKRLRTLYQKNSDITYYLFILLSKQKLTTAVSNSATATVIQMPSVPKIRGNMVMPITINIKPLHAEITKDHLALSRAVKKLALEMLKPFSRKANPIIREP